MEASTSPTSTPRTLRIPDPALEQDQDYVARLGLASSFAKRLLDIVLAIPVVVFVLPPLFLLVKLCQLWQSPGPLLFRQVRAGRNQVQFRIFKFRTMSVAKAGESEIANAHARIFPLGSILRRSKIDELPQFINVLLGQMSVVGPRPHHYDDCREFSERIPEYKSRFVVKPGITGLAQYEEFCGQFQWNCLENRVKRDVTYILDWTFRKDLALIFGTMSAVTRKVSMGVWRRRPVLTRAAASEVVLQIPSKNDSAEALPQADTRKAA